MTGRMPRPSMKKITAGQGPAVLPGVKTEAGQFPSRVLMVTSRRGMFAPSIDRRVSAVFCELEGAGPLDHISLDGGVVDQPYVARLAEHVLQHLLEDGRQKRIVEVGDKVPAREAVRRRIAADQSNVSAAKLFSIEVLEVFA